MLWPGAKNLMGLSILYLPFLIAAIFSAVAQFGAVYYVFDITSDTIHTGRCDAEGGGSYFLRLICLVTFVASAGVEMKESYYFAEYVQCIPTIKSMSKLDRTTLDDFETSLLAKRVKVCNLEKGYEVEIETIAAGGLTLFEKAWCWLWVLVKLSAEMLVLVSGSRYVLYADTDEKLILNSVVLLFITEIDDIAFSLASTNLTRRALDAMPTVGKVGNADDKQHRMSKLAGKIQFLGPWIQLFFLFGASGILWGVHC